MGEKQTTIRVSRQTYAHLRELAETNGKTKGGFLTDLIKSNQYVAYIDKRLGPATYHTVRVPCSVHRAIKESAHRSKVPLGVFIQATLDGFVIDEILK